MRLNRFPKITAILIALTQISGVGLADTASAGDTRYITVSATGTTSVTPDAGRINATISALGATSKLALANIASTATNMLSVLTSNQIHTKDIVTQSLTVYPEYAYPISGIPSLSGYRASQSYEITIRRVTTLGDVVDSIVESGADSLQVNGISLFVIDNDNATKLARAFAVRKARAKATSYGQLLGIKLGRVIYLEESSTPLVYPIYTSTAKSDDAATVVNLGQQKVTVSVTIRWAIG